MGSELGRLIAQGRASTKPPLSQAALAARVECSVAMIGKIEAGTRIPSDDLLDLIARNLGLNPGSLKKTADRARSGEGASAIVGAASLGRENARRANEVKVRVAALTKMAERASTRLDSVAQAALSGPAADFAKVMSVIEGLPEDFLSKSGKSGVQEDDESSSRTQDAFQVAQRDFKKYFREFFADGRAGFNMGDGLALAAGSFPVLTSIASASTGAAIRSLSRTSAAKSISSQFGLRTMGGSGSQGGAMVLAAIVAVPLAGVAGSVLLGQGSQIFKKQQNNERRLDEAQRVLEENEQVIATFSDRVARIESAWTLAKVKSDAVAAVFRTHDVLTQALSLAPGAEVLPPVQFKDLSERQQGAVETLAIVVTSLGSMLTLPIGLRVTATVLPALAADAASEEEKGSVQATLDPGAPEESDYIEFALDRLFAEIAMA